MKRDATPHERCGVSKRNIELQAFSRALVISPPSTLDVENREVEVAWSTGAIVRRYSWTEDTEFEEELVLSGARLGLFNERGAPFLNTHRAEDLDDVLGRTLPNTTRIEGGEGRSRVKFSQRARALEHLQDIRDGVSPEVSIRYRIFKVERIDRRAEGKIPLWRVVDWEPFELSGVPIAADGDAGYRSADDKTSQRTLAEIEGEDPMSTKSAPAATAADNNASRASATDGTPAATTAADNNVARASAPDGAEGERSRVVGIIEVARKLGISSEQVDSLIASGTSLDAARARMIDLHAEASEPATRTAAHFEITRDEKVTESRGITNSLLARAMPNSFKLDDNGARFEHMTLVEMARHCLERSGIKAKGLAPARAASLALQTCSSPVLEFGRDGDLVGLTSGDFPLILADVQNKAMRKAYTEYLSGWKLFSKRGRAASFKDINTYQLSEAPNLEVVNEQGEYTFGSITESREKYAVTKTGKRTRITFEMIVNDDMKALTRLPQLFGAAGARREADIVWGFFTSSHVMGDSVELFHSSHANL
ncbi:MAG: hypothetical protein RIS45_766, partial [Planctomycetota bacterium]